MIQMETKYRRTQTTVSFINYHFVFCPRYRRKIFDVPEIEQRFKELVKEVCFEHEFEVVAMECDQDHAHLFLSVLPKYSPSDVMKHIKGHTGRVLRAEFKLLSKMPNLWTRSFFVSTAGQVSSETIKKYVEEQRTRYD